MIAVADAFLGNPHLVRDLERVPCKGNWVAARSRYVDEQFGASGRQDVESRLEGAALDAFVHPPLPMVMSNVGVIAAIDRAILDGPMRGRFERMKHFGATIARYDVPVVYRVFFRFGSPGFILGRAGLIYGQYVKRGKMKADVGTTEGEITLTEVPLPYYLCEHGICGWLEAATELAGAKMPVARQTRCVHRGDSECRWHVAWR
ncbi:MAG: hypothetical protein KF901_20400 [Myxococcales bacterium]|nr:hypothetical protein [Myxococcales bacterium]